MWEASVAYVSEESRSKSLAAWPGVEVLAARLASATMPASSAAGTTLGLNWHIACKIRPLQRILRRCSALPSTQVMALPAAIIFWPGEVSTRPESGLLDKVAGARFVVGLVTHIARAGNSEE